MGDQDRTLLKRRDELDRAAVASFLESLADQVRSGRVQLEREGQPLEMDLPDRLHLDVSAKDSPKPEGVKHELELEIWWLPQA